MKFGRAPTTWRMCTIGFLRLQRDLALLPEAAPGRERHAHGGLDLMGRNRGRPARGNRVGEARPAGRVSLVAFEKGAAPPAAGPAGQLEPAEIVEDGAPPA